MHARESLRGVGWMAFDLTNLGSKRRNRNGFADIGRLGAGLVRLDHPWLLQAKLRWLLPPRGSSAGKTERP